MSGSGVAQPKTHGAVHVFSATRKALPMIYSRVLFPSAPATTLGGSCERDMLKDQRSAIVETHLLVMDLLSLICIALTSPADSLEAEAIPYINPSCRAPQIANLCSAPKQRSGASYAASTTFSRQAVSVANLQPSIPGNKIAGRHVSDTSNCLEAEKHTKERLTHSVVFGRQALAKLLQAQGVHLVSGALLDRQFEIQ